MTNERRRDDVHVHVHDDTAASERRAEMLAARSEYVRAFAPGSIGNLGPGLDVLGCAVTGAGDEVEAWWIDEPATGPRVVVVDAGHPELPLDAGANACAIAAEAVLQRAQIRGAGVALRVHKGLPLSAGQGGSGASAAAAVAATDALLAARGFDTLDREGTIACALVAEAHVAGRHLDNLAASLLGGVICVRAVDPPDVSQIPVNMPLWFALAHPNIRVRTADARRVLPQSFSRDTLIAQLASVASMVNALALGDAALFGRALVDHVAEPARAQLVQGFLPAKAAALDAGALGASLSGSGPSTFAACASEEVANAAAEAMRWAFETSGVQCSARVCTIDFDGAIVRREADSLSGTGAERT